MLDPRHLGFVPAAQLSQGPAGQARFLADLAEPGAKGLPGLPGARRARADSDPCSLSVNRRDREPTRTGSRSGSCDGAGVDGITGYTVPITATTRSTTQSRGEARSDGRYSPRQLDNPVGEQLEWAGGAGGGALQLGQVPASAPAGQICALLS